MCKCAAGDAEEDPAVSGGHSSKSVWGSAHAIRRQTTQHAVPCAGSHGGHTRLQTCGDAACRDPAGKTLPHTQ